MITPPELLGTELRRFDKPHNLSGGEEFTA